MKRPRGILPVLCIFLQDVLYGFGDPISKAAYESVPVFSLLTARYWIAFVFLMLCFGRRVISELREKRRGCRALILPCLCIAGTYLLNNVALRLTAATSVAFLRSMSTVMTPLLAFVVFRRKYSRRNIPVLILVLIGLYLLCGRGGLAGFGAGEALTLLAALLMGGALVFAGEALQSFSPITLTTVQSAASAVLATIFSLAFDGGVRLGAATAQVWLVILYLAILCTVSGYFLQNLALRSISAGTVSLLQSACPVMTALFSFFLLDEHLSAPGYVGAGLIVLCVVLETLIQRAETPRKGKDSLV